MTERRLSRRVFLSLFGGLKMLANVVENRQRVLSRKDFLEYAKDFGAAAAAFSMGVFTPPEVLFLSNLRGLAGTFIELNTRYIITASLLKDLSLQVPTKTPGLLIYPSFHWKSIKEYLEDDEKRRHALAKIIWLKNVPLLKSLFEGRNYISDGHIWSRRQEIDIQTI